MKAPEPPFEHLLRLTDDTGLFEHARGPVPRRECGYCVDDVARGLVVLGRHPAPTPSLVSLAERYLAFVSHAQAPDGSFHNRLGFDRLWQDEPALGDWWGRALWGLGTLAGRCHPSWLAEEGLARFESSARRRSPSRRAMAFAALGAAEVLSARPDHEGARELLAAAAEAIGLSRPDEAWPWPEPRLTYANAAVVEAVIDAGWWLGRDDLLEDGLGLLDWLVDVQTVDDHLSVSPVAGLGPADPRPGFDQQPIEAAALADACARALELTGGDRWATALRMTVGWFLGDNDVHVPLYDAATGGGCDGLEPDGRNANQGAESTLALVSTLQHASRLEPAIA